MKQAINAFGFWHVADFVKTRGRGYMISDGDGVAYSYSVFNDYDQIAHLQTHSFDQHGGIGANLYRSAPHIALLGLK